MRLFEIMQLPEVITRGGDQIHESVFRSHHLLKQVKDWLRYDVPPNVILQLIEEVEIAGEEC